MTDPSDETARLLARAAQGDQRAWDELVSEHTRLLWGVARPFRLDSAEANDVVQTTWLRLVGDIDHFEDPGRLVGWLITTARSEALKLLRGEAGRAGLTDSVIVAPIHAPTDWRSETWRGRALLLAALYFTLTAAAEFEFRSDLLSKLEAHLVVALALWGYYAERSRPKE